MEWLKASQRDAFGGECRRTFTAFTTLLWSGWNKCNRYICYFCCNDDQVTLN